MITSGKSEKVPPTHFARVLSPRGVYPAESLYFDDAAYVQDDELTFSVCRFRKRTGGSGDESSSGVEWLNPIEARLYGSLMLSVDRDERFSAFYPYPITEPLISPAQAIDKRWLFEYVRPHLQKKIIEPDMHHPGAYAPAKNSYRWCADISMPPIVGGPQYDFRSTGIDYNLAKTLYDSIDLDDALVIRGLTTLMKAAMLHFHYQFREAAIHSLFISMEVSFRLVVRTLKAKGIPEPTSKEAMSYIHDAFHDIHRVEKYFEEYYEGRVKTFHPENRYGVFPHAPLAADDYNFLYNDMLEVYAFLICGYVNPKHKDKSQYIGKDAT